MIVVIGKGQNAKIYDACETPISVFLNELELRNQFDNPRGNHIFTWPNKISKELSEKVKKIHLDKKGKYDK